MRPFLNSEYSNSFSSPNPQKPLQEPESFAVFDHALPQHGFSSAASLPTASFVQNTPHAGLPSAQDNLFGTPSLHAAFQEQNAFSFAHDDGSLLDYGGWVQADTLLPDTTPDLEMPDWANHAAFQNGELPDDIKFAVGMRFQTADLDSADVFQDIATSMSLDYGLPITREQVVQQFEHDKAALDHKIALMPPAEKDDFLALVAANSMGEDGAFPDGEKSRSEEMAHENSAASQAEPVARTGHRYTFEEGSRFFAHKTKKDMVEDPENAGRMISVAMWRNRMRKRRAVIDPDNPNKSIAIGALQARESRNKSASEGKTSQPSSKAEETRHKRLVSLVDDPMMPGKKITYKQRQYKLGRGKERVEDPKNPGKTILAVSLKIREKRETFVDDPENPGTQITQYELDRRPKSAMVSHPFVEGKMVKAASLANIHLRNKDVVDPLDASKTIKMGELIGRQRKEKRVPDALNEGQMISRQAQHSRDHRARVKLKRQAAEQKNGAGSAS